MFIFLKHKHVVNKLYEIKFSLLISDRLFFFCACFATFTLSAPYDCLAKQHIGFRRTNERTNDERTNERTTNERQTYERTNERKQRTTRITNDGNDDDL